MQNTDPEPIMEPEDANNFAHKLLRARVFDAVRLSISLCEQLTTTLLTPELIAQVFEELGISAAERGEPISACPWPSGASATDFGLLCRHDWLTGWRAATKGQKRKRKVTK